MESDGKRSSLEKGSSMRLAVWCLCLAVALSACQNKQFVETTKQGEVGVIFSALPPIFGGGVRDRVLEEASAKIMWPWETVYKVDTTYQFIRFAKKGEGDNPDVDDLIVTRTLDGNEVGLAVTVKYHVDKAMVRHVVQRVSPSKESIHLLVKAVALADIRTHLNTLRTRDYINSGNVGSSTSVSGVSQSVNRAFEAVKKAMNLRLEPEGIIVDSVIFRDHEFKRQLPDGSFDLRYQEQIEQREVLMEEREQEEKKVKTVESQKKQEFNIAQGDVNRKVEEADGYLRQARARGDAYFQVKENEAKQITAQGMAEVEALKDKLKALSGPGGRELLKVEIAKALAASGARFVLLEGSDTPRGGEGGKALEVQRVDTNQLLEQIGVFYGIGESQKSREKGVAEVVSQDKAVAAQSK